MRLNLSGSDSAALTAAIVRSFGIPQLRMLVFHELDLELADLVDVADTKKMVAFKLLRAAEQEGFTDDLVNALAKERPKEPVFRQFRPQIGRGSQGSGGALDDLFVSPLPSSSLRQGAGGIERPRVDSSGSVTHPNAGASQLSEPASKGSTPPPDDPFGTLGRDHRLSLNRFRKSLDRISLAISQRQPGKVSGKHLSEVQRLLEADSLPQDDDVLVLMGHAIGEIPMCDDPATGAMAVTALGARVGVRATIEGRHKDAKAIAEETQQAFQELENFIGKGLDDVSEPEWVQWEIESLTWEMQVELAELLVKSVRSVEVRKRQRQLRKESQSFPRENTRQKEEGWAKTNNPITQRERS